MTIQSADDQSDYIPEVRPFRLLTSSERTLMLDILQRESGLAEDQLAVNSWGFPVIPIPEPREAGIRMRLAPQNVTLEFLGHPIYWIDPTLTDHRDEETDEAWSIRMFYLILALGYWTENLQWVDFLQSHDFTLSEREVALYHARDSLEGPFDRFGLLSVKDLLVDQEQLEESTALALVQCDTLLTTELQSMVAQQMQALHLSALVLGGKADDPGLHEDAPTGLWASKFWPQLNVLNQKYEELLGTGRLGSVTPELVAVFTQVQEALSGIDTTTATLSIPVIRSAETSSSAFAYLTTYIGLSLAYPKSRESEVTTMVQNALVRERRPGAILAAIQALYSRYCECWRRLRLATVNYDRVQRGLDPFISYIELEVYLVDNQGQPIQSENPVTQADLDLDALDRLFDNQ